MIISELGDRDVSDDGDPDYEESGNETDGESENECGCGSAPVYSSISLPISGKRMMGNMGM